METNERREGLTRRQFVWSSAAGGLVAALAKSPGRALAQPRPRVVLRTISAWERSVLFSKPFVEFIDRVEKKSGGELRIEWKGGPEAVPPLQSAEPVSKGVFDMVHNTAGYYASAVPEGTALTERASPKGLHASGAIKLLDEIHREKFGVVFLGVPFNGIGYTILTKTPVRSLEFFKGKKIRTVPPHIQMLKALGAATVTIAPGEVYPALERGVVDGLTWPEIAIEERKLHEVVKYMMLPTYYEARSSLLVNRSAFEKLPPPLQALLQETTREVEEWGARVIREEADREAGRLKRHGLEMVRVPDGDAKTFLGIAHDSLWDQIVKDSPKYGAKLKEAFGRAAQIG